MNLADKLTWIWEHITNMWELFRKTPGVISYYKNWDEQNINNLPNLAENNFKFYVWQTIRYSENQFYSPDFYIWAIDNLLKNTSINSKIIIEVWTELKHIINDDNVRDDNKMTTDEQIAFINNIIQNYFKNYSHRIIVNDLSKSHIELFTNLEKKGIKWDSNDIDLNISTFNSNDLYNLLYQASLLDHKFFNTVSKTRPSRLKESENESIKYYWLAEIAFRITDYIKWINIQWWERRQNIYDTIIRDIISWWYNKILPIKKIYDFMQDNHINKSFDTLHFNKKKFEKEQDRLNWIKKIKNYISWVSLAVSLVIGWWIWWATYIKNSQESEMQWKIDNAIVELSPKMPDFVDNTDNFMRLEGWLKYDKLSFSKYSSEELAKRFISIYWEWQETGYKFIQLLILESMKDSKDFFSSHKYLIPSSWYDDFLKEKLIKNFKSILILKWYNIDNYLWEFEKYKEIMEYTSEVNENDTKSISFNNYSVKDIKLYKSYYVDYQVWYIECWEILAYPGWLSVDAKCYWLQKWTKILVAKRQQDSEYTIQNWISVSKELLNLL